MTDLAPNTANLTGNIRDDLNSANIYYAFARRLRLDFIGHTVPAHIARDIQRNEAHARRYFERATALRDG